MYYFVALCHILQHELLYTANAYLSTITKNYKPRFFSPYQATTAKPLEMTVESLKLFSLFLPQEHLLTVSKYIHRVPL